ncbi:hypothetical protein C8R44DRAFT_622773, partial [Mycena epipterygia]
MSTTNTTPAAPLPPPRSRKTHLSQAISDALKALPRHLKLKKNSDITDRNVLRKLKNAEHATDPAKYPDAASDEESFITMSDEEQPSPATTITNILAKLTPTSGRALVKTLPFFSSKRTREEDTGARLQAKKIRAEITLQPGMSLPVVFHSYLHDLATHNIYIPLSIFTSPNLEIVNAQAATLETIKLNAANPTEKQTRVLNTLAFEAKYLKEEEIDRGQWLEAARN